MFLPLASWLHVNEIQDFTVKRTRRLLMPPPLYYICKYCREIFDTVALLKSHKRNKHQDENRKVVPLNHFSEGEVKVEQEYDDGTYYECPESKCAASFSDAEHFLIHLENHSSETAGPALFHTADGRILTIDELPTSPQIFIPRIKLTSWTATSANFSRLVPPPGHDLSSTANSSLSSHSDSKIPGVTPTKMKLRPPRSSSIENITEAGEDLSDYSNDESGYKEEKDTTPRRRHPKRQKTSITNFHHTRVSGKGSQSQPHSQQTKSTKTVAVKPFHCKICNVGFIKQEYLVRHFTKHIENNPYKCKICGHNADSKHQLRTHMFRHNGYDRVKCKFCKKTFAQMKALRYHMQTIHALLLTPKKEIFPCEICGRVLNTELLAGDHLKMHKRREEINASKPFHCSICNVGFRDHGYLKRHAIIHTESNPYKCRICGYTKATSRDHLKRHMEINHAKQVKKVPCGVCGKLLNRDGLRRHVKVIHPNVEWKQLKRKTINRTLKLEPPSSQSKTCSDSHSPTSVDANGKLNEVELEDRRQVRKCREKNCKSPNLNGTQWNVSGGEHWRVATVKKILELDPKMEANFMRFKRRNMKFHETKNTEW